MNGASHHIFSAGLRSWTTLTRPQRWVLGALSLTGALVAIIQIPQTPEASLDGVSVLLVLLALATSSVTLKLPHRSASLSLDTVFVLTLLLSGHEEMAILVGGLGMAVGELRSGERAKMWHTVPANFAIGVLSAQSAAMAGQAATAVAGVSELATTTVLVAHGFYVANVLLVALVIAVTHRAPVFRVLRTLLGTYPVFVAAGSLAALVSLTASFAPVAVVVVTPLLVVLYVAVHSWKERLLADERHKRDIELMYLPTVAAISSAIEARNAADGGHHVRVQQLSMALAEVLEISDESILRAVRFGAIMHDLGRLALPDALLMKTGPLTPSERKQLEMHPVLGAELIRHIPFEAPVEETIRYHHERWDGKGYPEGLAGEAIPLSARLVAVAEAVDTMMSLTHYSRPMSLGEMLAEVAACSGTRYDPAVAAALPAAVERAELKWPSSHHTRSPVHTVIAESAVAQGLQLRLSDTLRAARDAKDVLSAVSMTAAELLPSDGWSLLLDPGFGEIEIWSEEDSRRFMTREKLVDTLLYEGSRLARDAEPVNGILLENGRRAVAMTLQLGGGSRGFLVMRLAEGSHDELVAHSLASAVAEPTAHVLTRIARAERGERQAMTDALTGLQNGLAFEKATVELAENASDTTLLALDLDGFKGINDHFGHHIGDLALKRVGEALRSLDCLGASRSYRKGGDEFVILLEDIDSAATQAFCHSVRDQLEAIELEVQPSEFLTLRTSIGVASGEVTTTDCVEQMLRLADEQMYADKQARPDRLPRGSRPVTYFRSNATRGVSVARP